MGSALEAEGSKYRGVGKTGAKIHMLGPDEQEVLFPSEDGWWESKNVQDYCFKGGTEINEQHPLMFLAASGQMENYDHGIPSGSGCPVGKLVEVWLMCCQARWN